MNDRYGLCAPGSFDGGGAELFRRCLPHIRRVASNTLRERLQNMDASHSLHQVGTEVQGVGGEALLALPWTRMGKVKGTIAGAGSETMQIDIAPSSSSPTATVYAIGTTIAGQEKGLGTTVTYNVLRYGALANALKIDARVTADTAAQDYLTVQTTNAAVGVIRLLRRHLAQGDGTTGVLGLQAGTFPMIMVTPTANFDQDVRSMIMSVATTGGGAGEGADCILGGWKSLRKLLGLSSTTNTSNRWATGFARDEATGLIVPHFMGLPCFRVDADETVEATDGKLWAVNRGLTGLHIAYCYGAEDTYGMALEETSLGGQTGAREYTAHGAYALVVGEDTAIAYLKGFSVAQPL